MYSRSRFREKNRAVSSPLPPRWLFLWEKRLFRGAEMRWISSPFCLLPLHRRKAKTHPFTIWLDFRWRGKTLKIFPPSWGKCRFSWGLGGSGREMLENAINFERSWQPSNLSSKLLQYFKCARAASKSLQAFWMFFDAVKKITLSYPKIATDDDLRPVSFRS